MKLRNEQKVCNKFKYPEGNNCAASEVLFFVLHREKNKNVPCVVRIVVDKTGIWYLFTSETIFTVVWFFHFVIVIFHIEVTTVSQFIGAILFPLSCNQRAILKDLQRP